MKILAYALVMFGILAGFGTTAAQPALPLGTYVTTIRAADIPAAFPSNVRPLLLGTWNLRFGPDSRYVTSKGGKVMVEGRYTVKQDRIVMTDEKGPAACFSVPGAATGTYRWSVPGPSMLKLAAIEDKCAGRSLVMTIRPLIQKK